jgi:diguanylate cyclase (GGDEF)-like protein
MNSPWMHDALWKLEVITGRGMSSNAFVRALSRGLYTLRIRLYPRDFLTGLLSRHAFQRQVEASLAAEKSGAVPLVDVDHFKQVNDRWGQTEGDGCLRHLACVIRDSAAGRTAGRLGGDEFAIYTDLGSEALGLAERVRARVARDQRFAGMRLALQGMTSPALTVTVGIAHSRSGHTFADLVSEADMALCLGKNEGRNRVAVFGKR